MIQYFATNRHMEKLGQAVENRDRTLRHKMSEGGYYFVDMDIYMAFYMGTTDSSEMPRGAAIEDSSQVVFDKFLEDPRIGTIVVCVHGFNVELFEAFTWFRVLTETMKHKPGLSKKIITSKADLDCLGDAKTGSLTAFIGFSWPSDGSALKYPSDQKEAIGSTAAFGGLLARIRKTGKRLNLICHSMGNYVACHTFKDLINKVVIPPDVVGDQTLTPLLERKERAPGDGVEDVVGKDWFVDTFVMIAPDVERRHVTKCKDPDQHHETLYVGPFYSGLQHLVRRKVNVYSRFDGALSISNIEKMPREAALSVADTMNTVTFGLFKFLERNPDYHWEKRLGEAPAPMNAAPGFCSLNATELAGRKIDHSDHIDAPEIAWKIAEELGIH
jgi:esterase/lipase superfamily enzyme